MKNKKLKMILVALCSGLSIVAVGSIASYSIESVYTAEKNYNEGERQEPEIVEGILHYGTYNSGDKKITIKLNGYDLEGIEQRNFHQGKNSLGYPLNEGKDYTVEYSEDENECVVTFKDEYLAANFNERFRCGNYIQINFSEGKTQRLLVG